MELLKKGKTANNIFKQKCCLCSSKLRFTTEDLKIQYHAWYFVCPVCEAEQWLNKKNELKRKIYCSGKR